MVVAVPEEMAVVEALQFHRTGATRSSGSSRAAFVLNACHERRFSDEDEAEVLRLTAEGADGELAPGVPLPAALRAARRQIRRRKLTRFYQARLRAHASTCRSSRCPSCSARRSGSTTLRLLAGALEAA